MVSVPCKAFDNSCSCCYFAVTGNGSRNRANQYCVMIKYEMSETGHLMEILISIVLQVGSHYLHFQDEQTGVRVVIARTGILTAQIMAHMASTVLSNLHGWSHSICPMTT